MTATEGAWFRHSGTCDQPWARSFDERVKSIADPRVALVEQPPCRREEVAEGGDVIQNGDIYEGPPNIGEIVELPEVGGLHHRYERRAA
jgi:hypothetical protein